MPELPALTGLYGKIPAHGDFVRRGLPASFCGPWDAWLQAGMEAARARLGVGWEVAWREAPPWRFWLPAGVCGPAAVAGVMLWSEDAVGRRFPITLAAMGADAPPPEAWFARAEAAARAGRDGGLDADRLAAVLGGEALPPDTVPAPFVPPDREDSAAGDGDPLQRLAGDPAEPAGSAAEAGDVLGALAAAAREEEPDAEGDVLSALIAAADPPPGAPDAGDPAPPPPLPPEDPGLAPPPAEHAPASAASGGLPNLPLALSSDDAGSQPGDQAMPDSLLLDLAGSAAEDAVAPDLSGAASDGDLPDPVASLGEDAAPPGSAGPASDRALLDLIASATDDADAPDRPGAAPDSTHPDPFAGAAGNATPPGQAGRADAVAATGAAPPPLAPDPPAAGGWWTSGASRFPPMVWPLAALPPADLFSCLLEPAA